ncbi:MAG: glucose 1-dehydrogenase [Spirochaetia bacterium]|jgi:NAD(P)-dependent dehydrogenase (short-subunit alcohol dehydrogenase family)
MRLAAKVAIVTGGAKGIGEAYSTGLAEEGASVIIADIEEEAGKSVEQCIRKAGNAARFVRADVSRRSDADAMVAEAVVTFGRVDILVNNAGILFTAPVDETTEEMWDKLLAVNVKGLFFCAQAAAREMKKQKSGKIINISSIAAIGGQAGLCAYSSTKAAVLPITRVFALELAESNIQVNAILPGTTDTGMAKAAMADPEWTRQITAGIPMKRLGRTRDLLGAVLYFASSDSDYCTGQTLIVDGGYSMI